VRGVDRRSEALNRDICSLATFNPTAIAVERVAEDDATLLDHTFASFTEASLLKDRDERVQIGHRLARMVGTDRVYAIDVRAPLAFDEVSTWAKANQRADEHQRELDTVIALAAKYRKAQSDQPISAVLRSLNTEPFPANDLYYEWLKYGGGKSWPGVKVATQWFERNAFIFARLRQIARPGDRIVVVYGIGHHFLLKHFIENSPGFRYVSPLPHLHISTTSSTLCSESASTPLLASLSSPRGCGGSTSPPVRCVRTCVSHYRQDVAELSVAVV
jgi:hypothetical protein